MAGPAPSLAFALESMQLRGEGIETVRIVEAGVSQYQAADLLSIERPQRGSKVAGAIAFLEQQVAEGPKLAGELVARGKELGFSESTLKRAKDELGIESQKSSASETQMSPGSRSQGPTQTRTAAGQSETSMRESLSV